MQSPNVKPEQTSAEPNGLALNHTLDAMDISNSHHNGNMVAGSKRKVNSASPRGVANLTPEQLARKRANDRQAQRAIRERTKAQIEALERRVQELTSQQPYQDIQNLVTEKERILRENLEIKRRLSAMMHILQPLMERDGMPTALTMNAQLQTTTLNNTAAMTPTNPVPNPAETTHPSPFTDRSHDTPISLESHQMDQSWNDSIAGNLSPGNVELQCTPRPDAVSVMSVITNPQLSGQELGEKLILNFLLDNPRQRPRIGDIPKLSVDQNPSPDPPKFESSSSSSLSSTGSTGSTGAAANDHRQAHLIAVQNLKPTCPLDHIFLDFLKNRRGELTNGTQQRMAYPSVSSLLNPTDDSTYSYSISKVFSDILRTFPDISSLPEQVGILYTMFQIMRWQIYPTAENYDRIPHWLTPRPTQLFNPHPAWIDYIIWPKVRDRLAYTYRDYPFENWFVPYTRTISCNWPYEPADCLLHNTDSDELLINPVFERHIRDLNNWSVGTEFAEAFPALVDAVKVKSDGRRSRAT